MTRSSTSKVGLDRRAVVDTAVRLVNNEGGSALTINRLARDLGVQPPSLYNHIDSLADLWSELALVNTTALGERLISAGVGKSGSEGIRAVASAYRSYVKEFPRLYQASLRASRKVDPIDLRLLAAEDRIVSAMLAIVASFGLTGDAAIHAVRALRSMVHGFTSLEVEGGFGMPIDQDVSFDRMIDLLIHGLDHAQQDLRETQG